MCSSFFYSLPFRKQWFNFICCFWWPYVWLINKIITAFFNHPYLTYNHCLALCSLFFCSAEVCHRFSYWSVTSLNLLFYNCCKWFDDYFAWQKNRSKIKFFLSCRNLLKLHYKLFLKCYSTDNVQMTLSLSIFNDCLQISLHIWNTDRKLSSKDKGIVPHCCIRVKRGASILNWSFFLFLCGNDVIFELPEAQ